MSGSVVIGSWRLCNLNSTSVQLWPSFQSIDLQQLQRERELMLELHINLYRENIGSRDNWPLYNGRRWSHTRSTATMLTLFDAIQDEFVDQKLRNCTSSQCFCHDNDR
ncbi:Imidazolonepropionase [Trichinella pseudospiralis]